MIVERSEKGVRARAPCEAEARVEDYTYTIVRAAAACLLLAVPQAKLAQCRGAKPLMMQVTQVTQFSNCSLGRARYVG